MILISVWYVSGNFNVCVLVRFRYVSGMFLFIPWSVFVRLPLASCMSDSFLVVALVSERFLFCF